MTNNYKYKNLDEALRDIIGSVLNDNSTFYEDESGRCSENYIPIENFDDVEDDILKAIKESKYISIKFVYLLIKLKEYLRRKK